MALVKADDIGAQINGFNNIPFARQIGLMIGLAAAIAIAVAIVMWSQQPSYRMLYGNLSDQEILEISKALSQGGVKFEVNELTGAVLVDAGQVHEARMKLAGLGLPKGSGTGYELLDKEQGFGTSQFMETARYHRAIEGELSRTISSLNSVQSARVHLAIPKQSAFVRNRKKASASVMLNLYQGRIMSPEQAASIAHMVASSVPNLEMENVTVVDQSGRMLTRPDASTEMGQANTQFDYRRKLEEYYIKRIEEIISPIVGIANIRAQVVADLDFTVTEQTLETFNPELPSIRSEQTVEEVAGASSVSGVPGMLSNQPAQAGATVNNEAAGAMGVPPKNSSRRTVRNYELDRTISHTRLQTGILKRLSAAVVIDDKTVVGEDGEASTRSLSVEEMEKITSLVKEAIGFDDARGDSVNVINASFMSAPVAEPAPEPGIMEQPWVWDVLKQVVGVVLALLFGLLVLKPILRSLIEKGQSSPATTMEGQGTAAAGPGGEGAIALPGQQTAMLPASSYEQQVEVARSVAKQEPHRMAQVVKEWVEKDG